MAQRRADGRQRVIGDRRRVVEEDHEPVPGEVLHRAAVGERRSADLGVVLAKDAEQLLRLGRLGERGEAAHVAEQGADLAPVAGQQRLALRRWSAGPATCGAKLASAVRCRSTVSKSCTLAMAIAAWSAKVCEQPDLGIGLKGRTSKRQTTRTPIGLTLTHERDRRGRSGSRTPAGPRCGRIRIGHDVQDLDRALLHQHPAR